MGRQTSNVWLRCCCLQRHPSVEVSKEYTYSRLLYSKYTDVLYAHICVDMGYNNQPIVDLTQTWQPIREEEMEGAL